jgi:WD40 repeat protein
MTITKHDEGSHALATSPDGTFLVSTGADGKMRLTELKTAKPRAALHIGNRWNRSTDWSPDGQWVVGGCKSLLVFGTASKKKAATLKGHKHEVYATRFSPDSTRVATGSGENWSPSDFSVRIWDALSGEELHRIKQEHAIRGVEWLDPDTLLALSERALLKVNARSGEVETLATFGFDCSSMAYCRVTGDVAATVEGWRGRVVIVRKGGDTVDLPVPPLGNPQRTITPCIAVRPGGRGFAVGVNCFDQEATPKETSVALLWDVEGREESRVVMPGAYLRDLALSPDGELLFTANSLGEIHGWHTSDGSPFVPAS